MAEHTGKARVVFTPSGKRGQFEHGTSLLQAARELGVDLDSVCGGRGLCGRCQVHCSSGEHSKHAITSSEEHLGEPTRVEARYQRIHGEFAAGRRLGCQASIHGDLVIDIPPESQVHRQLIRKSVTNARLTLNPVTRLHVVEVRQPDMHEPSGDLRRLKQALQSEWGLTDLHCGLAALRTLQGALRQEQWQITVAVHDNREILGIWPGFVENIYGLAIDVGSTTIAGHLVNLVTGEILVSGGAMNPQIRFGEDLMSRVSYVMMNPGGEKQLTDAVIEAMNTLVDEVCQDASIDRSEILELSMVANPVMHHLLLGINPVELGGAPFALATDESMDLEASALGIVVHPQARVYLLPCVAGHVGADTAGMVLCEQPHKNTELTLLVDVGTNAEIVLGHSSRLLACSSPTGPAFEGAQISGGQRAAPGAIERVRINRQTLEPRFSVIGCETWSDDPQFPSGIMDTGVTGICGSGIIEVVAEMFLAGIIDADGVINGALADTCQRIQANDRTFSYLLYEGEVTICITQNDVRQIQLAKAALYAGVRLLLDRLGDEKIERIRLAGAFGSHIDVKYAMVLGLIPDCDLQQVASAGNSAGTGALMALLDKNARKMIEDLVRHIEKVETAVEPAFQQHFVEAMAFPHKTAEFPQLGTVLDLPARKPTGTTRRRRSRRTG
ncbi:MAG: ASKHA domain-containing protein [Granulosicoccus sp.]